MWRILHGPTPEQQSSYAASPAPARTKAHSPSLLLPGFPTHSQSCSCPGAQELQMPKSSRKAAHSPAPSFPPIHRLHSAGLQAKPESPRHDLAGSLPPQCAISCLVTQTHAIFNVAVMHDWYLHALVFSKTSGDCTSTGMQTRRDEAHQGELFRNSLAGDFPQRSAEPPSKNKRNP